tara:strand:+ start:1916 stop:2926 length:1011 start_codon:yes stop_codon:yes gene_type:complete
MILFYCVGLHEAGGLTILDYFIKYKNYNKLINFFIDKRYSHQTIKNKNIQIKILKNNIFSRVIQEYKISKNNKIIKIVYINGLPPIFKNKKALSIVVFQNLNIFNKQKDFLLKWFFSRDFIRYIKFKLFSYNADEWIVFSEGAYRELAKQVSKVKNIKLLEYDNEIIINKNQEKKYNFFYPANLSFHKNHRNLIKAMIILSKENIFPKLLLTLNKKEIKKINLNYYIDKHNLKITSKHYDRNKIDDAYSVSDCLIYPSFNETLGLPLLEAKKYNLNIVASELDFVRDSIIPNQSFDPQSPLSIARAIKRYLNLEKNFIEKSKFLDKDMFFEYLEKS